MAKIMESLLFRNPFSTILTILQLSTKGTQKVINIHIMTLKMLEKALPTHLHLRLLTQALQYISQLKLIAII